MNSTVSRAIEVLRKKGIFGLGKSAGAYLYNRIIFEYWIQLRANYYRKRGHKGLERPFSTIWIDPNDVVAVYDGEFNQKIQMGKIKGGDWDKKRFPIEENHTYNGLRQHFCHDKDWENTIYYENAVRNIQDGHTVLGYSSVSDFEERLEYVDSLYESIQNNGYRSQKQIGDDDWDPNRHPIVTPAHTRTGEIGVNVARDGSLLHNDGIHRLSIAKILELETVPVQIIVRHKAWQDIRNQFAYGDAPKNLVERYGSHPDLSIFG